MQSLAAGRVWRAPFPVRPNCLCDGKEEGYYSDEGLDVELIVTGGINRLALIAGEVDCSSSGSASIVPVVRDAPLRVLYTAFYRTTLWNCLMTQRLSADSDARR